MRVAIFGGTFDPIHNAHLAVARAARDRYRLDSVLLVPAAQPPHKLDRDRETYEHRYRMVELACQGEHNLHPSRLEEHAGKSYSIDTILKVRQTLALNDELFFIIGADAFAEFTTWHRWKEVQKLVEFLVVSRPGHAYQIPPNANVHRLDSVEMAISSSDIRRKLHAGESIPELPAAVIAYIQEHNLYLFDALDC